MLWLKDNWKLIAGCTVIFATFGAGWLTRSWYEDSVKLKIEQVRDEVSLVNAEAISKIKVENKSIYAKTIERVNTEFVYKECVADPEMMSLTNQILVGK
jgi:hypothetical protein